MDAEENETETITISAELNKCQLAFAKKHAAAFDEDVPEFLAWMIEAIIKAGSEADETREGLTGIAKKRQRRMLDLMYGANGGLH